MKLIPGKLSFTADGWLSAHENDYIGITLHFLNENFDHFSLLLDLIPFVESHTGENIKNILIELFKSYEIPLDKILAGITDNGGNYKNAIAQLKNTSRNIFQIFYVNHTLQLCIKDALNDSPFISALFEEIATIVAYLKKVFPWIKEIT